MRRKVCVSSSHVCRHIHGKEQTSPCTQLLLTEPGQQSPARLSAQQQRCVSPHAAGTGPDGAPRPRGAARGAVRPPGPSCRRGRGCGRKNAETQARGCLPACPPPAHPEAHAGRAGTGGRRQGPANGGRGKRPRYLGAVVPKENPPPPPPPPAPAAAAAAEPRVPAPKEKPADMAAAGTAAERGRETASGGGGVPAGRWGPPEGRRGPSAPHGAP